MKLSILGSGSGGNALYIEADTTRVLVDAGLPLRELRKRLESVPGAPAPERMDGLLVTHEHSDHGGHAQALVERGLRAWCTAGTRDALELPPTCTTVVERGQPFTLGAFQVVPVPLPHDAADPVGFVLAADGARIGVLTDCGHPNPEVAAAYAGCDVLLLETNHDPEMLRYGTYPMSLKRRIGGRRGHLSNEEAADLLRMILNASAKVPSCIVLVHLSQMNNRAQLARATINRALGRRKTRVLVASQSRVMAPIICSERGVEVSGGVPGEQLSLIFETRAS